MKRLFLLLLAAMTMGLAPVRADDPAPAKADDGAVIAASLKWQTGTITLKDGLAKINLTDGFRFLDHDDAEKVLHDLWGNPPDPDTLGMIFPADLGPLDKHGWGVIITYDESGYVKDDDAQTIDYTKLLKQMQDDTQSANDERQKEGYPSMQLVGWAAPPRYDQATHKLYWAKELRFGTDPDNQLNYNIRVLGRRGVLVLNAVALMDDFPAIQERMPDVISMVDFQPGNLYTDYTPGVDKVATYGIAALVAGGVVAGAAKLGLLKFLWPVILVAKKFIILIFVGIAAGFKKVMALFKGKSTERPFTPPPSANGPGGSVITPPTLRPPPSPADVPPLRPPGE